MKKKFVCLMLAVLLALSLFTAIPALAATSTQVITSRSGLSIRVRETPDRNSTTDTVAFVKDGSRISLIEPIDASNPEAWSYVKVSYNGAYGYLKNKYIRSIVGAYGYDPGNGYPGGSAPYDGGSSSGSRGDVTTTSVKLGVVSTAGGAVNVRATPNGRIKGTAADGSRLTISGKSGGWYLVKTSGGITGYIHGNYVAEGIPAYTTADSGVNLRRGAGTSYGVITSLSFGTSIRVLARMSNWSYVKAGSQVGYISNSYYSYE